MSHVRQQIREAIAVELTGLTTTGSNVFQSRGHPLNDESLPAIKIYTEGQEVVPEASAMGNKRAYALRLGIEVRVRPTVDPETNLSDADDLVDDICAEVQAALAVDDTLGGLVKDLDESATDLGFEDEAENDTGWAKMTFVCLYRIDRTDPETAIS